MKARNLLMIFALVVATGSACSAGSQAERADDSAQTQNQAQEEEAQAAQEQASEKAAETDAQAQADKKKAKGESAGKKGTMQHCPMEVEGTTVSAENTEDGVALVFTTTTGDVAELRERVQWMADQHGEMMKGHGKKKGHAKMKEHGDKKGPGKMKGHDKQAMKDAMAATTVSAEEIDAGMKLVFTAEDAAHTKHLQEHMARHAEKVNSGSCPMKYHHSKGKAAPKKS